MEPAMLDAIIPIMPGAWGAAGAGAPAAAVRAGGGAERVAGGGAARRGGGARGGGPLIGLRDGGGPPPIVGRCGARGGGERPASTHNTSTTRARSQRANSWRRAPAAAACRHRSGTPSAPAPQPRGSYRHEGLQYRAPPTPVPPTRVSVGTAGSVRTGQPPLAAPPDPAHLEHTL